MTALPPTADENQTNADIGLGAIDPQFSNHRGWVQPVRRASAAAQTDHRRAQPASRHGRGTEARSSQALPIAVGAIACRFRFSVDFQRRAVTTNCGASTRYLFVFNAASRVAMASSIIPSSIRPLCRAYAIKKSGTRRVLPCLSYEIGIDVQCMNVSRRANPSRNFDRRVARPTTEVGNDMSLTNIRAVIENLRGGAPGEHLLISIEALSFDRQPMILVERRFGHLPTKASIIGAFKDRPRMPATISTGDVI